MTEAHIYGELRNVIRGAPLWPGDTVSHAGARECARRGWIERDGDGRWVPTDAGRAALLAWGAA